eukprot:SAG11_NODE_644_length_7980_cov_112.535963_5_plen_168_part_00
MSQDEELARRLQAEIDREESLVPFAIGPILANERRRQRQHARHRPVRRRRQLPDDMSEDDGGAASAAMRWLPLLQYRLGGGGGGGGGGRRAAAMDEMEGRELTPDDYAMLSQLDQRDVRGGRAAGGQAGAPKEVIDGLAKTRLAVRNPNCSISSLPLAHHMSLCLAP